MSRLTKRVIDEVLLCDAESSICKEVCKSMDDFDHPCDVCPINEAIKKLAHYEDIEEQGRLIELPCAVGDTVYVKMLGGGLAKAKVRDYVHFLTDGFCLTLTSDEFPKQHIPISEIGKTVFLTPEEAEAKLAEIEGE